MNTPPHGASGEYGAPHLPEHAARVEPARPVRAVDSAATPNTMRLADEFFYLAHDDQTGRPRLFESATGHGLAAALLAELYGEGRVTFEGRQLRVTDTSPPTDWLQHLVLDRLVAEPRHTTRTWLAFLATTAYEQVATRMWQLGLLQPQQVGRLWRHRTVYVPTDMNTAAWSWARLSFQLRNYQRLNAFDVALAGVALHTQLSPILLDGTPLAVRAFLRQQIEQAHPPLRDLLADLGAVVGGTVLSHRTS
ncbi:GPP34 family phosphoprotein [Micromonospora sp. WMMD1082]|uniref:GOLPH3/VPS74 family protein n=1 Tax=Micromonospora sp. WMMD1082 TaxID=3016104 RepID=UPI002417D928|nr:GPP34 family phosphoprotein [Micromonospora sp. WMMD1082]MDG4793490.1 GPP34 family phosphoprotein [Micromonospora sp. WMMD1082]